MFRAFLPYILFLPSLHVYISPASLTSVVSLELSLDLLGCDAFRLAVTLMLMHPSLPLASVLLCLDPNYHSEKDCLIELIGGKT